MDIILLNLAIFQLLFRPADFVQGGEELPLFAINIYIALAFSFHKISLFLNDPNRRLNLIVRCYVWVSALTVISHFNPVHFSIYFGRITFNETLRNYVYFLTVVSIIDTRERLLSVLRVLLLTLTANVALAVLDFHGVIDLPQFSPVRDSEITTDTGEKYILERLRSNGIIQDPNDLSMLLMAALFMALYFLARANVFGRVFWLGVIALYLHAFYHTHSRGGFLGFLCGTSVLLVFRFGIQKGVVGIALVTPVMMAVLGGRQTSLDPTSDTGYERIMLWGTCLQLVKENPIFGVGHGRAFYFLDKHVPHNSYITVFAEAGVLAGCLFVGMFYFALKTLWKYGKRGGDPENPELYKLAPYLTASLASMCGVMFTISRSNVMTTYLFLGIYVSYMSLALRNHPEEIPKATGRNMLEIFAVGVGSLVAMKILVRYSLA